MIQVVAIYSWEGWDAVKVLVDGKPFLAYPSGSLRVRWRIPGKELTAQARRAVGRAIWKAHEDPKTPRFKTKP